MLFLFKFNIFIFYLVLPADISITRIVATYELSKLNNSKSKDSVIKKSKNKNLKFSNTTKIYIKADQMTLNS